MVLLRKFFAFPAHQWICRFFGAVFAAAAMFNLTLDGFYGYLDYYESVPVLPYLGAIAGFFLLECLVTPFLKRFDMWFTAVSALGYGVILVSAGFDLFMTLSVCLTEGLIFAYLFRDDKLGITSIRLGDGTLKVLIAVLSVLFCAYVSAVGTLRYLNYSASTFDLGVFAQTFHYMKTTGLPLNTCERGRLMSHFAVHISPIFYLLLPGYMLFPSPIYLQIAQVVVLTSGVIPLYLLTKHLGYGNRTTLAVCTLYLLYPALMGGCNYDFHENAFLTPLLLWLLYCLEANKPVGIYIAAVLTLAVKEDAAIFVACIAIYAFCYQKRRLHGGILLGLALAYFAVAIWLLSIYGDGDFLSWRYANFITEQDDTFMKIVKVIFLNPGYMLFELINTRKLEFLIEMLVPLCCLPLFGKKLGQLVLLIPMLLLNMITDYEYQHSINFQYVFGIIAMLFFLLLINLKPLSANLRRTLLPIMLALSAVILVSTQFFTTDYFKTNREDRERIEKMDAYVEKIPSDPSVSVAVSGYFMPHLSDHDVIYDDADFHLTDYVLLDLRPGIEPGAPALIDAYRLCGYDTLAYEEDFAILMYLNKEN